MEFMIYQKKCNKCGWFVEGLKKSVESSVITGKWVERHNNRCSGKIISNYTDESIEESKNKKSYKKGYISGNTRSR